MARGYKDEFGQWAHDARRELDLSADWVGDQIGVHRTTVVRAEGKQRTPAVARAIARLLVAQAREKGVILPPMPGAPEQPAAPVASGDLSALVAALDRQTAVLTAVLEELRMERTRIPSWLDPAVIAMGNITAQRVVEALRTTEP